MLEGMFGGGGGGGCLVDNQRDQTYASTYLSQGR